MGPAKKNTLSFGMVSAPVGVCAAAKSSNGPSLKMIAPVETDEEGNLPERGVAVKQRYMDPTAVVDVKGVKMVPLSALHGRDECGRAVERGRDTQTGEDVLQPIDVDAYDALAERIEYMQVEGFVPLKDLGPYYERVTCAHYLQPQAGTPAKPLGLLRHAMETEKVAAVVRFSVGARERVGIVKARHDKSLVVLTVEFADRWKQPDEEVLSTALVELSKREKDIARAFVQEMVVDVSLLDDVRDESAARQQEMLGQIMEGEVPQAADAPARPQPADLMEQLTASIEQAKKDKPKRRKKVAA